MEECSCRIVVPSFSQYRTAPSLLTCLRLYRLSRNFLLGGYSDPHGVSLSSPLLLFRIGLAITMPGLPISDAVHCNRSCSALQPPLQCTASVLAVHCILHANICNLSRKRLQPPLQTFATAPANVCGETTRTRGRFDTTNFFLRKLSRTHVSIVL